MYRLITTSGKGCGKDSTEITFKTFPNPVPAFTSSEDSICHNGSITFTLTDGSLLPTSPYTWDFGDGSSISTAKDPSHVFTNPHPDRNVEYYVTLTVELNGCSKPGDKMICSKGCTSDYEPHEKDWINYIGWNGYFMGDPNKVMLEPGMYQYTVMVHFCTESNTPKRNCLQLILRD